jgi:hypothetical protein
MCCGDDGVVWIIGDGVCIIIHVCGVGVASIENRCNDTSGLWYLIL